MTLLHSGGKKWTHT